MYPTWAAAGRRVWRCPVCALWIALLLQSVLNVSASGESPTNLSFSPFSWVSVGFQCLFWSSRHSSVHGCNMFESFWRRCSHFRTLDSSSNFGTFENSCFFFFPFDCFLRVCLAHPNHVCQHSPPPHVNRSLFLRLSSFCDSGASTQGKTWPLWQTIGGLLTSQLDGYCGPSHPLNNLDQFKDKTSIKSIRRQTVVNKV